VNKQLSQVNNKYGGYRINSPWQWQVFSSHPTKSNHPVNNKTNWLKSPCQQLI